MGPHLFVQDVLRAEHCREMEHQMQQRRGLVAAQPSHRRDLRHLIMLIGSLFVSFGKWLERVELRRPLGSERSEVSHAWVCVNAEGWSMRTRRGHELWQKLDEYARW
jgi:hypothetical protein